MHRDRRILEKVDELGILLALLEEVVGARVTKKGDAFAVGTRADEPVKVRLDGQARSQCQHLHIAQLLTLRSA